jgi:DNA polymerase III gamma/tau subunit
MVLKARVSDPVLLGVPESLIPDLQEQAALFSREDLLRLFDAFLKIESDLKHATQVRFELEMGLIELAHIARMRSLEDLIAEFSGLVSGELPEKGGATPTVSRKAESLAAPPAKPAPVAARTPAPARVDGGPAPAPEGGDSPRALLSKITSCVRKESLQSNLQSLAGAVLRGDTIILDPGSSTEFFRRQIKENLSEIADAASEVFGRRIGVRLGGEPPSSAPGPAPSAKAAPAPSTAAAGPSDPLERAKREPVVQSFLDVFPGPVKAEDSK